MPTGVDPDAIQIHTLIEPAVIAGTPDARAANLIYGGEVTMENDSSSFQIARQHFGSPPGRSCQVQIPTTIPTCFIDDVVRDSNDSPVP